MERSPARRASSMASSSREQHMGVADISKKPKKSQRISQACDFCNRRSIKCRPSVEFPHQQCQNCHDFGIPCTYNRPQRRRRQNDQSRPPNAIPSQPRQYNASQARHSPRDGRSDHTNASSLSASSSTSIGNWILAHNANSQDPDDIAWQSFATIGASTIRQYLVVYIQVVFPIHPLFHTPTLWDRFDRQQHLTDRGFFASIMSACALAAAKVRDGATFIETGSVCTSPGLVGSPHAASTAYVSNLLSDAAHEMFFAAAKNAVLKEFGRSVDHGLLRACGLLALNCMQNGQIDEMHRHMGHYHTLSAVSNFHDESCWVEDLDNIEIEERRRIFWGMYQTSVLIACAFNGPPRIQSVFVTVGYPSMFDDFIADTANFETSMPMADLPKVAWLHGWNSTTEMYRLLEHALTQDRAIRIRSEGRAPIGDELARQTAPAASVNQQIMDFYNNLPTEFKHFNYAVTTNVANDIYAFQATHVQAVMQLCRMTLAKSDPRVDGQQICGIVNEVLTALETINMYYRKAMSASLIYPLRYIGVSLVSVLLTPLTPELSQEVHRLLHYLCDLLDELESGMHGASAASTTIQAEIARIHRRLQDQDIRNGVGRVHVPVQPSEPSMVTGEVHGVSTNQVLPIQAAYQPMSEYDPDTSTMATQPAGQSGFYLPAEIPPSAPMWEHTLHQHVAPMNPSYNQSASMDSRSTFGGQDDQHLSSDPPYGHYQAD